MKYTKITGKKKQLEILRCEISNRLWNFGFQGEFLTFMFFKDKRSVGS